MKNEDMIAEIVAHTKHIQETNSQYAAFEIFQSKWYARVLFELCQKNPSRFGELKKAIPEISNVVLTSALRGFRRKEIAGSQREIQNLLGIFSTSNKNTVSLYSRPEGTVLRS